MRACPVCGLAVQYSCHHDLMDVNAVEMPPERAAALRRDRYLDLLAQADELIEDGDLDGDPDDKVLLGRNEFLEFLSDRGEVLERRCHRERHTLREWSRLMRLALEER